MWFQMTLRCDYICIKWFIICFGIIILISLNEFVKNQNTRTLLDSIPLCILYNYLLNVWLTSSITIFILKFSWGTKPLDCFVRCKVERGSLGKVNNTWSLKRLLVIILFRFRFHSILEIILNLWILVIVRDLSIALVIWSFELCLN